VTFWWAGQNYDYEEREFEDQHENLRKFRGFADDNIQQYENFNEEVRAFEDNFADSFLKAFAGNVRAFNDENVSCRSIYQGISFWRKAQFRVTVGCGLVHLLDNNCKSQLYF